MASPTHNARQTNDHDAFHESNLERTLEELQAIVKEHEDALVKVRAMPPRTITSMVRIISRTLSRTD